MTKILIVIGSIIGFSGILAGCHTVAGAGQDLQAGGHAVTQTANETSAKI